MRIAIVEDHPAERELIATMCAEYFNGRNVGATAGRNAMQTVCDVFPDAKSFIESWKNSRYDLLLLDCYLSDENLPHATTGLDIAWLLRNQNDDCAIVFITSSTDFAVLGYEVQASGYLLKPVNRKTFEATMERVEEQLKAKPPVTHLAKAQSPGTVGFQLACGVRQSGRDHGPAAHRIRPVQRALRGIHVRGRHPDQNPYQFYRCGPTAHRVRQLLPHRARRARQLRLRVRHHQRAVRHERRQTHSHHENGGDHHLPCIRGIHVHPHAYGGLTCSHHSAKSSGTASPKPPRQVCSSPSESSSTRCPAWHCAHHGMESHGQSTP